jgi:predicted DNA-binding transcriptional regulator YafY
MPKAALHSALARQWELIRKLPSRPPGKTAASLASSLAAEGYVVSKRTVERDLVELSRLFPLRCNDVSVPFGWYWMPGHDPEIPALDLPQALSLYLAEEVLRASLPPPALAVLEPRFRHARAALAAAKGTPHSRWRNKVRFVSPSLALVTPKIAEGVHEELQGALLSERTVEVKYRAFADDRLKSLTLHPLALIHSGPVVHLVATAFKYPDVRQYALHRFVSVKATAEPAKRPRGFDVDQYIKSGATGYGSTTPIKLKARVSGKLAAYLRETPLAHDQSLRKQGDGFLLSATVPDSWHLRWWVLSQSPDIRVTYPANVAEGIKSVLTSAADLYLTP